MYINYIPVYIVSINVSKKKNYKNILRISNVSESSTFISLTTIDVIKITKKNQCIFIVDSKYFDI